MFIVEPLGQERDIIAGIEDDIDHDPFTPSKHKRTGPGEAMPHLNHPASQAGRC